MRNDTDVPYQVKKGSKIAQGILEKFTSSIPIETTELEGTQRSQKGFGSTTKVKEQIKPVVKTATSMSDSEKDKTNEVDIQLPYNIYMSNDSHNNRLEHNILLKGKHKWECNFHMMIYLDEYS